MFLYQIVVGFFFMRKLLSIKMKYYLEKKSGPLSFDKHMKKIMIIIFGQEMIKLLQLSTINYIIMAMFE